VYGFPSAADAAAAMKNKTSKLETIFRDMLMLLSMRRG
jgi:hypothetical protein